MIFRCCVFGSVAIALGGCARGSHIQPVGDCETPTVSTASWAVIQSYANRIEISAPNNYVRKNWTKASDPRLLEEVTLWGNDKPANRVRFAASSPSDTRFQVGEQQPATLCTIPVQGGAWRVRLHTVSRPPSDPDLIVSAQLAIPGDTSIIHFLGVAQDSTERAKQLAMLGSARVLVAIRKQ